LEISHENLLKYYFMEKSYFEAQFSETKKSLESSRAEINEFLKQKTLDERDRVRLTRVLQLVERYQPEREDEKYAPFRHREATPLG
jgi:hypothetical protein